MITDEEYVKRIRKNLIQWDRWRIRIIVLHTILLMAVFALLGWITNAIVLQMGPFAGAGFGLVIGLIVGMKFGFLLVNSSIELLRLLWPNVLRSERLMIRYYDALMVLNKVDQSGLGEPTPPEPFAVLSQNVLEKLK